MDIYCIRVCIIYKILVCVSFRYCNIQNIYRLKFIYRLLVNNLNYKIKLWFLNKKNVDYFLKFMLKIMLFDLKT